MSANRVEKLVYWYLRFNGYLTSEIALLLWPSLPGSIV